MQTVLILQCFICKLSLFCSALYAQETVIDIAAATDGTVTQHTTGRIAAQRRFAETLVQNGTASGTLHQCSASVVFLVE